MEPARPPADADRLERAALAPHRMRMRKDAWERRTTLLPFPLGLAVTLPLGVTVMPGDVAVQRRCWSCEVTASITEIVGPTSMVAAATVVQAVPSADSDAVKVEPARALATTGAEKAGHPPRRPPLHQPNIPRRRHFGEFW